MRGHGADCGLIMKVTILEIEDADPVVLAACLQRIKRFYGDSMAGAPYDTEVTINCYPPERDGFVQHVMHLPYLEGGGITIGAIKRGGATEVEFHS